VTDELRRRIAKAIQKIVAADRHPVNRLVEEYEDGRLSWTLAGK
jgi:hypothetical protein